jgi:hypothetical protein
MNPAKKRSLRDILQEATGGDLIGRGNDGIILPGEHETAWSAYIENHPEIEKGEVHLRLCPADTLTQARIFYKKANTPERILALRSRGRSVEKSFHFGFMQKGVAWTNGKASVADYMRYWQENIDKTGKVDRAAWTEYWDKLVGLGFAEETDHGGFKRDFGHTEYKSFIPRPGIRCIVAWRFEEAEPEEVERPDTQKGRQFRAAIKARINELLVAVSEPAN